MDLDRFRFLGGKRVNVISQINSHLFITYSENP